MKYYTYVFCDPRKPGRFSYKGLDFVFLFEPYYVGKGKDYRHRKHFKPSAFKLDDTFKARKMKNIIKEGFSPLEYCIIIENSLSEEESLNKEKFLIKKIGRSDLNLGPLTNLTDGGEGWLGAKSPFKGKTYEDIFGLEKAKQLKEEKRNRFMGNKNPMFGKPSYLLGKKLSEETKKRISESNRKIVIQLDKNGNIVAEYKSLLEASKAMDVVFSAISNCILGISQTCCGFKWKYKNECS